MDASLLANAAKTAEAYLAVIERSRNGEPVFEGGYSPSPKYNSNSTAEQTQRFVYKKLQLG